MFVFKATSQSDSIDANLIMAYEAAMKEGSESSNQFKLVTLGAEGAGKTSSINTLLNLPFQPNQESTVGASVNKCTVDMHYATSKWKKITATFQITEIPKRYKKEINAAVKLAKSDPVKPDAVNPNAVNPDAVNPDLVNLGSINPVPQKPISQKVIDEVKEIIASKEEIPQDGHIRIVVFDIGGQEVYYDVHFLFLAIEDVALLVFDCSKGLDDPVISRHRTGRFGEKILTRGMISNIETIELLLHSVYSRGQKAPDGSVSLRAPVVIMLGAHAEGLSDAQKEMIIQTICQRFYGKPFLEHLPKLEKEAFHFLSNSNPDPESVEHLRSTVLKAAEVVIATKRPISYLKFEGEILQKIQQAEVRLTRESAIDIARDAGVEGKQAIDALLRYFTNKGILLYYPEVKSLKMMSSFHLRKFQILCVLSSQRMNVSQLLLNFSNLTSATTSMHCWKSHYSTLFYCNLTGLKTKQFCWDCWINSILPLKCQPTLSFLMRFTHRGVVRPKFLLFLHCLFTITKYPTLNKKEILLSSITFQINSYLKAFLTSCW